MPPPGTVYVFPYLPGGGVCFGGKLQQPLWTHGRPENSTISPGELHSAYTVRHYEEAVDDTFVNTYKLEPRPSIRLEPFARKSMWTGTLRVLPPCYDDMHTPTQLFECRTLTSFVV